MKEDHAYRKSFGNVSANHSEACQQPKIKTHRSNPPIASLSRSASFRGSRRPDRCLSITLFLRDSLTAQHVYERTHEHPPAPRIVDIDQPVRPIHCGSVIHERLRDAICLWLERPRPQDPATVQVEEGIATSAHAMEVITLDSHCLFRSASTVLPTPFRRRAEPR